MPNFAHARMINVSIWGQRVGTIIPSPKRGYYAFLYDKAFVSRGVQIAPISMPLGREPFFRLHKTPRKILRARVQYVASHGLAEAAH